MEPNQLQILPVRPSKKPAQFKRSKEAEFITNYYEIALDSMRANLFQYALDVDLPDDSSEMLRKVVRSLKKTLIEKIGFKAHRGKMIWGCKDSKIPISEKAKFEFDNNPYEFECIIKKTKELSIEDLLNSASSEERAKILQVLNINVKDRLRDMKMQEMGRGKFYERDAFNRDTLDQAKLSVWRGFKLSVNTINSVPLIQIDVCSRVLRSNNLLEVFNGSTKDYIRDNFTDMTIVTGYGNRRTFKIEEILFNMNPKSEFYSDKHNQKITFEKYFKEAYGLQVTNQKQPLLRVVGKIEKQIKNGKLEEIPHYINLIPEFVHLTGMSDEDRANHKVMQELAQFTKLLPETRLRDVDNFRKKFNQTTQGMFEIKNPKKMRGNILQQPTIELSSKNSFPAKDGSINIRKDIKQPAHFKDWVIVYSHGQQSKYDDNDADYLDEMICKASEAFAIKVDKPGFVIVKGKKAEDWKNAILQDTEKNGTAQIYVVLVQKYEQPLYKDLKKFFANQLCKPSQFVKRRTVNAKSKNPLSCASKIILQMNAKLGHPLWEVKTNSVMGEKKNFMYGAISISKGKGGYTLGFVGTINGTCTAIYSDVKIGIKRKEQIPPALLEQIFINWAKTYYKGNKKVPETIILYREGLSEQQIKLYSENEVNCLQKMVQTIGKKTKTENYRPNLIYIVVNKKINSRMYTSLQEKSDSSKFVPKVTNPVSGSIIMEEMSIGNAYDFYLVPQFVTQGTCTPTHFQIAYDSTMKIPQESIAEFTFQQCFNYYNWPGAVRVPSCLQSADKLSKLVGQSIRENIKESDLKTKPHFL